MADGAHHRARRQGRRRPFRLSRERCWLLHRVLIVTLAACLIAGCSGGETASESDSPERSPVTESVEPVAPDGEGDAPSSEAPADSSIVVEPEQESAPTDAAEETADDPEAAPSQEPSSYSEPPMPASSSGLRVVRAYVCKGIEQGEPTEAGKSFVPEDGVLRLCCFSEIAGAAGPDTVFHIWRWGDREMARVVLDVKSSRWRTWSTKRILDEWRGEWHVDVTDSDGGVLTRLEFSVE